MSKRTLVLALALTPSVLFRTSFIYAQLSGTLQISFIDVGQGDSILMSTSGDTRVLVDAGQPWAGPTIVAYLQAEGTKHIDVVVMSHGHTDHIGGLIELFRSDISVGSVADSGQLCTTATCATVWAEIEKRSLTPTPAVASQTHTRGEPDVEALNPQPPPRANQTEDSAVKVVTYRDTRFLFTGDIGFLTENTLLPKGISGKADVLKIAHDGSRYSSGTDFVEAISADLAVICVGDNAYGHPAEETVERLQVPGADVFRTDDDGKVVILSDGQTIEYPSPPHINT